MLIHAIVSEDISYVLSVAELMASILSQWALTGRQHSWFVQDVIKEIVVQISEDKTLYLSSG